MADRELTDMQKAFLVHLMSDEAKGDPRIAMTMAGYQPSSDVMYLIRSLRKEILETAEEYIAGHAGRAAFGMVGVMDDALAPDIKEKMVAMKEVMDRAGLIKKDGIHGLSDIGQGVIFVLPAKKKAEDDGE